jgi:hypothetical protein
VLLALGIRAAPIATAAPFATADPSAQQAIAELNMWRAEVGEAPVSTAAVSAWNTGCRHHDVYMQKHALTHFETDPDPAHGYTPDGADAGRSSVLAVTGGVLPAPTDRLLPGPVWDAGVFHRAALLQPRLAVTGFASVTAHSGLGFTTWSCMWVGSTHRIAYASSYAMDDSRATRHLTLYPSPANGAFAVPTMYRPRSERPDPTDETGVPGGSTLGWPISVDLNGPWRTSDAGASVYAHGVTARLAPDGTPDRTIPVVISQCGPGGCARPGGTKLGAYFDGGFGIFPLRALASDTTYRVVLTGGSVHDARSGRDYALPTGYSWCFSTGDLYVTSNDCRPSATGAGAEPAAVPVTLRTVLTGAGSVSVPGLSCLATCSRQYRSGATVVLTAVPGIGQSFLGWSGGGCSGSAASCQVALSSDTDVSARFSGAGLSLRPLLTHPRLALHGTSAVLTFDVRAAHGAPGVSYVGLGTVGGMRFAAGAVAGQSGVRLRRLGHGPVPAAVSLVRDSWLVIALKWPVHQLAVSVQAPALTVSPALARSLRGRRGWKVTFGAYALDAGDDLSTAMLTFKPGIPVAPPVTMLPPLPLSAGVTAG